MSTRWVLGIMLLLLVITAIWSAAQDQSNGDLAEMVPHRTTYNALPSGCKALLLTLQQCGYHPTRWQRSWVDLPPSARVLLVLSPPLPPTTEEWSHLVAWVKTGGRLIASPPAGDPRTLAVAEASTWTAAASTLHSGLAEVPELTIYQRERILGSFQLSTLEQDLFPLYALGPRVAVSYRKLGQGGIVLVRDGEIFANEGIARTGNLEFALSLIGAPGAEGSVLFDEFHHGYGFDEQDSLWKHLPTTVRVGLLQLLMASLVILWALSRRTAAAQPEFPPPHQRSEYLDSMASLLERASALRLVARVRGRVFGNRLGHLLRLGTAPTAEQLAAAHPEAARVLRGLEEAATVSEICALAERELQILEELRKR